MLPVVTLCADACFSIPSQGHPREHVPSVEAKSGHSGVRRWQWCSCSFRGQPSSQHQQWQLLVFASAIPHLRWAAAFGHGVVITGAGGTGTATPWGRWRAATHPPALTDGEVASQLAKKGSLASLKPHTTQPNCPCYHYIFNLQGWDWFHALPLPLSGWAGCKKRAPSAFPRTHLVPPSGFISCQIFTIVLYPHASLRKVFHTTERERRSR